MIDGMPIEIGGKKYTLPPLGLAGLKKTAALRSTYGSLSEEEQLDALLEMVHAALVRNYPDLTLDEVKDRIHAYEVTNLQGVLPALFEKSGLRKRGEAQKGSRKIKAN